MTFLKSRRRRQAERAVDRACRLRDDATNSIKRGGRPTRNQAKRSREELKEEVKRRKAVAKRDTSLPRRKSVRVGRNVSEMVQENPGASIGGALALAIALGAGVTYWTKRD